MPNQFRWEVSIDRAYLFCFFLFIEHKNTSNFEHWIIASFSRLYRSTGVTFNIIQIEDDWRSYFHDSAWMSNVSVVRAFVYIFFNFILHLIRWTICEPKPSTKWNRHWTRTKTSHPKIVCIFIRFKQKHFTFNFQKHETFFQANRFLNLLNWLLDSNIFDFGLKGNENLISAQIEKAKIRRETKKQAAEPNHPISKTKCPSQAINYGGKSSCSWAFRFHFEWLFSRKQKKNMSKPQHSIIVVVVVVLVGEASLDCDFIMRKWFAEITLLWKTLNINSLSIGTSFLMHRNFCIPMLWHFLLFYPCRNIRLERTIFFFLEKILSIFYHISGICSCARECQNKNNRY